MTTTRVRPKARPVQPPTLERREALKQYILLCARDGALSLNDIKNAKFFDRVLKILSGDLRAVFSELGAQGGANLLQMGASLLGAFASGIARKNF